MRDHGENSENSDKIVGTMRERILNDFKYVDSKDK
jgi:hypothetical protein